MEVDYNSITRTKRVICSMITNSRKLNINNSLLNLSFPLVFDYECILYKEKTTETNPPNDKAFCIHICNKAIETECNRIKKEKLDSSRLGGKDSKPYLTLQILIERLLKTDIFH